MPSLVQTLKLKVLCTGKPFGQGKLQRLVTAAVGAAVYPAPLPRSSRTGADMQGVGGPRFLMPGMREGQLPGPSHVIPSVILQN
jgi:hypothetical protein